MRTPLGPVKSVLIREVSLFQGLNLYCIETRKSVLIRAFQGVHIYRGSTVTIKTLYTNLQKKTTSLQRTKGWVSSVSINNFGGPRWVPRI